MVYNLSPLASVSILGAIAAYGSPLYAQVLQYGTSPRLLAVPSAPAEDPSFRIDANTTCPTPSLAVSGFAATGSDYIGANTSINTFGYSGVDNYGGVASLRIPLSGRLARACKEYAEAKAQFEKQRAINQLINAQSLLLKQCIWVKNRIDFAKKDFDEKAFAKSFGALLPCKDVAGLFKSDASADNPSLLLQTPFSKEPETIIERREIESVP